MKATQILIVACTSLTICVVLAVHDRFEFAYPFLFLGVLHLAIFALERGKE